jgi:mitotic spindle assembly checkpoint protein MAD1
VPISVVDRLKLDLVEMEKVVAEKEKRMRRLREIWTDKAAEFRDVIASVLGYHVYFLPNGKVRVKNICARLKEIGILSCSASSRGIAND